MKEIPLTQGKIALIDDEDFERVNQYKWFAYKSKKTFYARTAVNGQKIDLHRFIMNAPDGLLVDHQDRDGLNCVRENMRLATHAQNSHNVDKHSDNTSGYKGVVFNSECKPPWQAQIGITDSKQRKTIYLGHYETPEDAARAYDEAAKKYHGEFARLNFE